MLEMDRRLRSALGARRVGLHHLRLILFGVKHATPPEIMVRGDGSLLNDGAIEGKWRGLAVRSRGS